jgi:hypothetical protein
LQRASQELKIMLKNLITLGERLLKNRK